MASTRAKMDAKITVPTGGYVLNCTDASGGPTAITLPAGTYWHSSENGSGYTLAEALEFEIDALMGQDWTVSFNSTAAGTAIYSISCAGATCTVTWTDTELRDLLGFTGNLSGSTSYTAANAPEGFWRSTNGWQSVCGISGFDGFPETDKQDAENSAGYLFSVTGQTKYVNSFVFPMEPSRNVIRVGETNTNESFQSFVEQVIHGGREWSGSGGPIRFYPDIDSFSNRFEYYVPGFQNWTPARLRENWDGYWIVEVPRLVKVPT